MSFPGIKALSGIKKTTSGGGGDPPPPSGDKMVFAHWFPPTPRSIDNEASASTDYYGAQFLSPSGEGGIHYVTGGYMRDRPIFRAPLTGSWWITDQEWEIQKAIDAGIDGWCVNIMGLSGAYWDRCINMLTAATSFPNFKIILMPDCIASGTPTYQQWGDALAPYVNHPSIMTYGGLPVIAPFYADNYGATYWSNFKTYMANTKGKPVAFMPCGLDPQVTQFAPISFGISYWGGRSPAENSVAVANQAKSLGKLSMVPVNPQDYRAHKYARVYWEAQNSTLFRSMWDIAEQTDSEWVQIVTWNDFTEHAHIAPSLNQGEALLWLTYYYAYKFKNNGVPPTLTKDRIIISHRKHGHAMVPALQSQLAGKSSNSPTPAQDTVEVLAFLTTPRTLTINVGATQYTHAAPAGLSIWSKPLGTGTISASVSTVTCTSPYAVVSSADWQDMQYKYTMAVAP